MVTRRKPATKPKAARKAPPRPREQFVGLWFPHHKLLRWIDHNTALAVGTVYACVRMIAEQIAGLPWGVTRVVDGRRRLLDYHDLAWLLDERPNDETTPFQFREFLLHWALLWGNGYAEIERDAAGNPLALWPIMGDAVTPERDAVGRLQYRVQSWNGERILAAPDVFHLRGPTRDGVLGQTAIATASGTIAAAADAEEFAHTYFANGATPSIIFKMPPGTQQPQADAFVASWMQQHGGAGNSHGVAALPPGVEVAPVPMNMQDSQFLESRKHTAEDICRLFGVPPQMLGLGQNTFSNFEQATLNFATLTLAPWINRLEREANFKLVPHSQVGELRTKIDTREMTRGDTAARVAMVKELRAAGVINAADAAEMMDLQPPPDEQGGSVYLAPANMVNAASMIEAPPEPVDAHGSAPPTALQFDAYVAKLVARVMQRESKHGGARCSKSPESSVQQLTRAFAADAELLAALRPFDVDALVDAYRVSLGHEFADRRAELAAMLGGVL